jgi:hypothetical protein
MIPTRPVWTWWHTGGHTIALTAALVFRLELAACIGMNVLPVVTEGISMLETKLKLVGNNA